MMIIARQGVTMRVRGQALRALAVWVVWLHPSAIGERQRRAPEVHPLPHAGRGEEGVRGGGPG
jgi:hypothetical protein